MTKTYINDCGVEWANIKIEGRSDLVPIDYWRLDIPKNTKSMLTVHIRSLEDLYKLLNAWNFDKPGIWQYWKMKNE